MVALFATARVLFSIMFVVGGAIKLLNISDTAAMIAAKVTVPTVLTGLATHAETATGIQTPQLLAIAAGCIEFGFGLLLASGFATRVAAIILALFVTVATFYFHDFWNQVDPERMDNMIHVGKNLSIFAGLLVFLYWAVGVLFPRRTLVAFIPAARFYVTDRCRRNKEHLTPRATNRLLPAPFAGQ